MNDIDKKKKLILFGAGKIGREALDKYGKENVAFFCDNDIEKQGKKINGIIVISFEKMINIYCPKYIIMVTIGFPGFLIGQLENAGISEYLIYHDTNPKILKYDGCESIDEKEHNDFLREYVKASNQFDILENIDNFKNIVKKAIDEAKEKGVSLNYYTRGKEEEGYRYGNLQTLQRYADINTKYGIYVPIVSHVVSFPIYSPSHKYKTAVIFSGNYYKEKIHKIAPWVPVFTVGPYIHYADEIYNKDEMKKKKECIGTMLLVFLPHTLENVQRDYDRKNFLDAVNSSYKLKYDKIWVCAYFADVNDEICKYAEKIGMHVVSAGFRFDPMFNDRLKTMIQLSDAIVCGDIGSFLAYSMYLEKPISRIDISDRKSLLDVQYEKSVELNVEKTGDCIKFENDFYEIFDEHIKLNNKQKMWMDSLAGFNQIRSKEYIKRVFEICEDIWVESDGNYRNYSEAVRKIYYKYNAQCDYERMFMLKQAVGSFLD